MKDGSNEKYHHTIHRRNAYFIAISYFCYLFSTLYTYRASLYELANLKLNSSRTFYCIFISINRIESQQAVLNDGTNGIYKLSITIYQFEIPNKNSNFKSNFCKSTIHSLNCVPYII